MHNFQLEYPSQRQKRKIQQIVRYIQREEEQKRDLPPNHKPRKKRKVIHPTHISIRQDQQEVFQDTTSYLTPNRDKNQVLKLSSNVLAENSFVNSQFDLNEMDITQYLTSYQTQQQQNNTHRAKLVSYSKLTDLGEPIEITTDLISQQTVSKFQQQLQKSKVMVSAIPFGRTHCSFMRDRRHE